MNLDELPFFARFGFISITKTAILMKKEGQKQKQFEQFCKGIWETMELNGIEKMEEIINKKMASDLLDCFKTQ